MAKNSVTSFDLDVEEEEVKPQSGKSAPEVKPLKKSVPKSKLHKIVKVEKQQPEKAPAESAAPVALEPAKILEQIQPALSLQVVPTKISDIKLPKVPHTESHTVQHVQVADDSHGIQVDPVVATVVGATAVAAGTAAAASGIATPVLTAFKAGIIKAKMALGLSSKVAVVAGGSVVAAAAMIALEKKFDDYDKDIQTTKKAVGDIGDQIKRLDELLNSVKVQS
jgi:cell division protein FtsL